VQVPDFTLPLLGVVMLVVIFRYLHRRPATANSAVFLDFPRGIRNGPDRAATILTRLPVS